MRGIWASTASGLSRLHACEDRMTKLLLVISVPWTDLVQYPRVHGNTSQSRYGSWSTIGIPVGMCSAIPCSSDAVDVYGPYGRMSVSWSWRYGTSGDWKCMSESIYNTVYSRDTSIIVEYLYSRSSKSVPLGRHLR